MTRPSLDALSERRSGTITNHEEVLSWLRHEDVMTVAEVAKAMSLSQSTVRRYLGDLVEAGYLRVGYSTERRAVTYFPAPAEQT